MKTLKLIIMPDGSAKELNPNTKPEFSAWEMLSPAVDTDTPIKQYEQAEAQRKSYEVDYDSITQKQGLEFDELDAWAWGEDGVGLIFKPNLIIEAKLIDENTVRVVKIIKS
jgi:hypothetical protein